MLIKNISASRFSSLGWWILRGSCAKAVQTLHRRSPRSAILSRIPRPRDIGRASNLRKYHECLAWYPDLTARRDGTDDGTGGWGWSRRAERGVRVPAGRRGYIPPVYYEPVHPPAGKSVYTRDRMLSHMPDRTTTTRRRWYFRGPPRRTFPR